MTMRNLAGRTFGSYRLEEPLGRGGMGEVYRARHLRLTNRQAAVKVLPSYLGDQPEFLHRFEQEANSAASLDHPNILPVWDYGEQDGVPYLAMPLVAGGSLKELIERRGPVPLDEAAQVVSQLGAALDYAHKRGIIHRDVKPANVLLAEDGRPLLVDFGIAKAIEAGQTQGLTRAGASVGTPEYMAPEQIEGRAGPRSDLYSLGVVLYQLLAGRVPFTGNTPYEVAYKQMHTPLPPIREVNPDLPAGVERVLGRALAKDPAERYGSGRELADAFNAAVAGARVPASPHDQATGPLIISPAPPAVAAPVASTRVYQPAPPPERTRVYAPPAPPSPPPPRPAPYYPPPARRDPPPRASRWPLVAAAVLGLLLVLGLGGLVALTALNRESPTPTPNLAATSAAQSAANAATTATAGAAASATQGALAALNATATAGAAQSAATTATAQAQATAAAQAAAQVAAATATAAGQANATATAAANAAALATQTAAANAAGTATAQAQPTATPVPPTATKPAPTRTPVANWGPVLAPLEGGKVYNDPAGRFSFRVPQDWTKADTPPTNTEVAFVAPGNLPNMNVGLEDVSKPPNVTLDRYNQASEDQLKKLSGYTPVSLTKVVVDNHPAYKRVFKATVSGREAQFQQVYFLDNNTAHVQTFTTLPQNFAQQERTFDGVAGSYRVGTQ